MKLKVVIMILSIVACFFAVSAQAAQMSVEPAYQEVFQGENVTINIMAYPEGSGVYSASYTLYFNNMLFCATSLTQGPFLSQDGVSTMIYPTDGINNTRGTIEYAEGRVGTYDGVNGSGVLATITFQAIGVGISPLNITDLDGGLLVNSTYARIPTSINNGSAKILAPLTSFLIRGYVSYEDDSPCNNSSACIANLDTCKKWTAETNETSNYYQLMLASSDEIVAGNTLRFNFTSPDGCQWNITEHTVTQTEVDAGGFEYNVTLEFPVGDVNGDGEITSADAAIALQMVVCGEYDSIADVNQDNSVTSLDALMIMQAAVGRITVNK